MEMTSGCLRPDAIRQPGRPIRGPHGGWQKQEIETLQQRIDEAEKSGESLRSVFDQLSRELGRKPNSIRNFYYAQIRTQDGAENGRALPFETFSSDEVEHLVEYVLTARAQGMSVRACVRQLADGDRTRMLRYQNKYRSTIRTRPELVHRIMDRLAQDGVAFVSPYTPADVQPQHNFPQLHERARQSEDPMLSQLFSSLDYLLNLAMQAKQSPEPVFTTPQDTQAQRKADRLRAHCDMLRIALSDEQERSKTLRQETMGMVTMLKEYIALPDCEKAAQSAQFCHLAAARLSAVECALMEPPE